MKNYDSIADGTYVREHRTILIELGSWRKMTDEEKQPFKHCRKCELYDKHLANEDTIPCPCTTCEHRKTEVQIDNQMTALRRKYL